MTRPNDQPAPWLFSLLMLPLGIYLGFIWTALPFLLGKAGVPVDQIAQISALLQVPGMLMFVWTPVVDIKLRRRTWLLLGAAGAAASLIGGCPIVGASRLKMLTLVFLAGGMIAALVPASCGGLMARMIPATSQSRASGWNQAGQLAGGSFGAAAALWLARYVPLEYVGLVMAALACLPAFFALTIHEPAPAASSWLRGRFTELRKEGLAMLRCPERRWGALLLVAPCCTAAAQTLLPALASQYGVGATGVILANGVGDGIVLAFGTLGAALVPGTWDRRLTYVSGGLANALAVAVLLAANRPWAYFTGSLLYLLTTGFCWARFVALALEVIGPDSRDPSGWYSVLNSAATVPVNLMIWLDGVGFHRFGLHGLLWTDAAPNVLMFIAVVALFLSNRPRRLSIGAATQ